ncbi:hypothetical protein HDK77DRAFT_80433 [Phyllosticta capitalensis]|uniref:uncharacterized protein n=1 Tax=Phyllosticta capitalensis TaxID=121624 RepID=UPI00312D8B4B
MDFSLPLVFLSSFMDLSIVFFVCPSSFSLRRLSIVFLTCARLERTFLHGPLLSLSSSSSSITIPSSFFLVIFSLMFISIPITLPTSPHPPPSINNNSKAWRSWRVSAAWGRVCARQHGWE